jgi:transposase-like protein
MRAYYPPELKADIVAEASKPGARCADVAERHGIRTNLVSRWVREAKLPGKKRSWMSQRAEAWIEKINELTALNKAQADTIAKLEEKLEQQTGHAELARSWDDVDEVGNTLVTSDETAAEMARLQALLESCREKLDEKDNQIAALHQNAEHQQRRENMFNAMHEKLLAIDDALDAMTIERDMLRNMMIAEERKKRKKAQVLKHSVLWDTGKKED